jgi:hypothetical protein
MAQKGYGAEMEARWNGLGLHEVGRLRSLYLLREIESRVEHDLSISRRGLSTRHVIDQVMMPTRSTEH